MLDSFIWVKFEHASVPHAYMGVQMYANKHTHNTHKHGCCSSNLLCYRADVTAPITITGPNLHHKTQEGPNPAAPRGLVRNPQVRQRKRQKEGTSSTLILTFRLWAVGGRALLLVQETLRAQRGFGVQVLLVWTGLLHLWQATGQVLSAEEQRIRTSVELEAGEGCWSSVDTKTKMASLLLLFDGLDAFHQVLLCLCVWVQRLILRDDTQIRTDLLMHLQMTQHHTVTPNSNWKCTFHSYKINNSKILTHIWKLIPKILLVRKVRRGAWCAVVVMHLHLVLTAFLWKGIYLKGAE